MRRVSLFLAIALIVAPLASATAAPRPAKRLPALTPVADDALQNALERGRLSPSEYALQRARSLFELRDVRAEFGSVARANPHAATMILRDLAVRLPRLSGDERELGEAILARPDGGSNPIGSGWSVAPEDPVCSAHACVHYVASTEDAPALTDTNANSIPDYVDSVSSTVEEVWTREITQMGWRAPKSDANSTNSGATGADEPKIDFYLADLGRFGVYGYCTSDDPKLRQASLTSFDVSSYCVLDDDFSPAQFSSGANGLDALRVTTAHEFNHASHFAYDIQEDHWLLEAVATWMEDEVYDSIDDNRQYLQQSPIADPQLPLDTFFEIDSTDPNSLFAYGTWVFIRYLSETFDPAIVTEIFARADGAAGAPDEPSIRAVGSALAGRGSTLRASYADFAAKNVDPSKHYTEGAFWPKAPRAATHTLAAATTRTFQSLQTGTSSAVAAVTLDHLSSQYVSFRPGNGVASSDNITIAVNLPNDATAPRATIASISPTGTVTLAPMTLDASGGGQATVPFGSTTEVVLVLSNASARFDPSTCFSGSTRFSCGGARFTDENQRYAYSGAIGDTAVDPGGGGGTPGGDTTPPLITNVSDGPDPFSPNGDGRKDIWNLRLTTDEAGMITLTLKNSAGRRVFVGRANLSRSGAWRLSWDGRGSTGRVVKNGTYRYSFRVADAAGNLSRTHRGTVTVRR